MTVLVADPGDGDFHPDRDASAIIKQSWRFASQTACTH